MAKKLVSLLVALAMVLCLIPAMAETAETTDYSSWFPGVDTSEHVVLTFLVTGNIPTNKTNDVLKVFNEKHMKDRLNEVSMKNWFECIDKAFVKSGIPKSELHFLCCLHFKRSMFDYMLTELGLAKEQSIYLENYGHIGQIDQILLLHLAQERNLLQPGTVISMIAAGIGYAWGANVIRWG